MMMTGTLFALGACHLVTAWGLHPAALAGRVALSAGGLSVMAIAVFPAPSSGGSLRHGAAATVAFALMAAWPLLAARRDGYGPWTLRPAWAAAASALMAVVAAWFLIEINDDGIDGAAERVLTFVQSLWPFVVAVSCRRPLPA